MDVAVAACELADGLIERRRFAIADQIIRASTSVPANIAEGYALGTRPQLVRTLRLALGSNEELRTHLEVVRRWCKDVAVSPDLPDHAERTTRLVVGLLKRYGANPDS
jgi:four helix bundle protein